MYSCAQFLVPLLVLILIGTNVNPSNHSDSHETSQRSKDHEHEQHHEQHEISQKAKDHEHEHHDNEHSLRHQEHENEHEIEHSFRQYLPTDIINKAFELAQEVSKEAKEDAGQVLDLIKKCVETCINIDDLSMRSEYRAMADYIPGTGWIAKFLGINSNLTASNSNLTLARLFSKLSLKKAVYFVQKLVVLKDSKANITEVPEKKKEPTQTTIKKDSGTVTYASRKEKSAIESAQYWK